MACGVFAGPTQRNACDPATARQIRVLAGRWRCPYPCTRAPSQVLLDSWRAVPGAARTSSSYSRHRGSVGTSGAVARPASGGSSPVSLSRKRFRCPKSAGTRGRVPRRRHAHARTQPCRAHRQRAEVVLVAAPAPPICLSGERRRWRPRSAGWIRRLIR